MTSSRINSREDVMMHDKATPSLLGDVYSIRVEGKKEMKKRLFIILSVFLFVLILSACATDYAPQPESDSSQSYKTCLTVEAEDCPRIPVDDGLYTVSGTVVADVDSLVRQTEAAQGSMYGSSYGMYGSYFGPGFGGKGFVRLQVESSDSYLAPFGATVIIKTTDTKASVLLPGDVVEFICRHQYEAIAAVREFQTFDPVTMGTWELDYCRMTTPQITRVESVDAE